MGILNVSRSKLAFSRKPIPLLFLASNRRLEPRIESFAAYLLLRGYLSGKQHFPLPRGNATDWSKHKKLFCSRFFEARVLTTASKQNYLLLARTNASLQIMSVYTNTHSCGTANHLIELEQEAQPHFMHSILRLSNMESVQPARIPTAALMKYASRDDLRLRLEILCEEMIIPWRERDLFVDTNRRVQMSTLAGEINSLLLYRHRIRRVLAAIKHRELWLRIISSRGHLFTLADCFPVLELVVRGHTTNSYGRQDFRPRLSSCLVNFAHLFAQVRFEGSLDPGVKTPWPLED